MFHVRRSRKVNVQTASVFKHWVNCEQGQISAESPALSITRPGWGSYLIIWAPSLRSIWCFLLLLDNFAEPILDEIFTFLWVTFLLSGQIFPLSSPFCNKGEKQPFHQLHNHFMHNNVLGFYYSVETKQALMNFNSAQNRPCYSIQSYREENLSPALKQVERPATVIVIPESIKLKALSGFPTKEGETKSSYPLQINFEAFAQRWRSSAFSLHKCGLISVLGVFS